MSVKFPLMHGHACARAVYREVLRREMEEGCVVWDPKRSIDELRRAIASSPEAQTLALQRPRLIFGAHALVPVEHVVREAFSEEPQRWSGALRIYAPGKIGELLVLAGFVPVLRARLPAARLVLHTLAHYVPLLSSVVPGFDEVAQLPFREASAIDAVDASITGPNAEPAWPGFMRRGRDLHVGAYRSHPFFEVDELLSGGVAFATPFYRAFAEAVGVVPFAWQRPQWSRSSRQRDAVLCLPTTNRHSSTSGRIPFSMAQWDALARAARESGLEPVATSSPSDGCPPWMRGWEWRELGMEQVIDEAFSAKLVVGGNTGLLWAAAIVGGRRVVMLDESGHQHAGYYDPIRMGEVMGGGSVQKVSCHSGWAAGFECALSAIRSVRSVQ